MASVCCIIGNGGHARSVARLIVGGNNVARSLEAALAHYGYIMVGKGDAIPSDSRYGIIAIGSPEDRARVFVECDLEWLGIDKGESWGTVADTAHLMPGSVVMPNAVIGDNVLINTGASVDHDCVVGAHSHIAPGAVLCGDVKIGERCFIGPGAVIVRGVTLEAGTFIPAGTLVCGPSDLRRPQRVLLHDRAGTAGTSEGLLY